MLKYIAIIVFPLLIFTSFNTLKASRNLLVIMAHPDDEMAVASMLITFGPDGDTGHSDHRYIGAVTTEIILREGWVTKYPLYYVPCCKKILIN